MSIRWKTCLAETKRIFKIIFDTRDLETIRSDFFSHKWISKEELSRLIIYEEEQFIVEYTRLRQDYQDLLSSFNLNALSNYELLERKMQGQLKR